MTEVIKFLTQNDEEAIVEAIQRAEKILPVKLEYT